MLVNYSSATTKWIMNDKEISTGESVFLGYLKRTLQLGVLAGLLTGLRGLCFGLSVSQRRLVEASCWRRGW